jgi:hypothetical protein
MARSVFRWLAAGLLALGVFSSAAGAALAVSPDPTLPPAWPLDTALTFRWTTNAVPPAAMQTAVKAAAADATASRQSRAPSYSYSSSAANGVSYGTTNPCGVNGLECFQRDPVNSYWHLWFRENGHRYDWGTLTWCEMAGSPNGCYRAETSTLDELGHVAGLDHHVNLPDDSDYADAVVQTYSHVRPQVGWNASAFGPCDVATLQQLYNVVSSTTLYSTCLDMPTTLAISASTTQVPVGGSVTFTATLRSAGTGRLASNAMAGRVVVLQARSGTTWTDLLTMSAGSTAGTYKATYSPRYAQDYRAVFRKPAREGVRASTSGTITVSITCSPSKCPISVSAVGQS